MTSESLISDDLLAPISPDQPGGKNLRWEPAWDQIKEARRADDNLEPGKWKKRDSKSSDWRKVEQLASDILRSQSKDLQIAMWLTEAELKLHGFRGLSAGLRVVKELILRYWDSGLYPPIETGPADRVGPLAWLNDKLIASVTEVPITRRSDAGDDYGFLQLQDARARGSESSYKTADGEIDEKRKRAFDKWVGDGNVSLAMFQDAVIATPPQDYQALQAEFEAAYQEFKDLEKVIDEKFGDATPNLGACRNTFAEMQQEIANIAAKKQQSQMTQGTSLLNPTGGGFNGIGSIPGAESVSGATSAGWSEAEQMIRSGKIDAGLAAMARLALAETSGRNRFQRKLLLAEVCLSTRRNPLARTILEELAEQIDEFKLEAWESSELVGAVWTRLYRLYKQPDTAREDEAKKLFERLCHLDPWQALSCSE
jgi:type VI secretion system protein ImpA